MAGGGPKTSGPFIGGKRAQRQKKYSGIIIIFPGKPGKRLEDLSTKDALDIIRQIFGRPQGIREIFAVGGADNGRQRGNSNQGGSNEKTRPLRKRNRGSV